MKICRRFEGYEYRENVMYVSTDGPLLKIMFVEPGIVRIVATFESQFKPEASYTLVTTAWDDLMDDVLKEERRRVPLYQPQVLTEENQIVLKSDELILKINKYPFGIDIYDTENVLLYSELKEKSYVLNQGRRYHYLNRAEDDKYFGFGEKTGKMNKARRRMIMANRDAIGYDAEISDPLYKHIPFYIKHAAKWGHTLSQHQTGDAEDAPVV
jgi:alpha-glucosidase